MSCGSDACSAKNVPSYGPLEFPGTEEVNKIRDRGSARIMKNKCILQFSKSQKPMCVLKSVILWDVGQDSDCPGSDTCINSLLTVFCGGNNYGSDLACLANRGCC